VASGVLTRRWLDTLHDNATGDEEVTTIKKVFLVPASLNDTFFVIQKIEHLWCRPAWTDTKDWNYSVDFLYQPTQKINFQK
jgi:hypothetical protein